MNARTIAAVAHCDPVEAGYVTGKLNIVAAGHLGQTKDYAKLYMRCLRI